MQLYVHVEEYHEYVSDCVCAFYANALTHIY